MAFWTFKFFATAVAEHVAAPAANAQRGQSPVGLHCLPPQDTQLLSRRQIVLNNEACQHLGNSPLAEYTLPFGDRTCSACGVEKGVRMVDGGRQTVEKGA